ncbi:hypothetical protein ACIQBJ_14410 [Kitasatospora sp. NPDC088391]|uniref:hypothetical protein n=1 Tax=Kitasatospora sp. NPDC088391 TaxID=3364074 RepID=UPI0037F1EC65
MSASTPVLEKEIALAESAPAGSVRSSVAIGAYVAAVNAPTRALASIRAKVDRGLVRYDAWFLIFTAVILALGATIFAGLVIWCVVYQGKKFTGSWSFKDFGLKVNAECV